MHSIKDFFLLDFSLFVYYFDQLCFSIYVVHNSSIKAKKWQRRLRERTTYLLTEEKSVEVTSYNEGIFHRHGVAVQQTHTHTHAHTHTIVLCLFLCISGRLRLDFIFDSEQAKQTRKKLYSTHTHAHTHTHTHMHTC